MPALVISNVERPSAEVSVVGSMTAEIPQGSAVIDRRYAFTPLPPAKSCTQRNRAP